MIAHLLLLLIALTPPGLDRERDFERGLESAQSLAETQRWSQARQALYRLLETHERAPYLVAQLSEIVELYKRCSFFEKHPSIDAEQSIDGELAVWNSRSGQITLRYRELNGDFIPDANGVAMHPIRFIGPYRIEVSGRLGRTPNSRASLPSSPQILIGVENGQSLQIGFGLPRFSFDGNAQWVSPKIIANGLGPAQVLEEATSTPLQFGERYKLLVEVGVDSVTASVNGILLLQVPKSRKLFGRVAVIELPGLNELSLSGLSDPDWINSRLDQVREEAWIEFRDDWSLVTELPAWVSEHLSATKSGNAAGGSISLKGVSADQLPALNRFSELLSSGQNELGLTELSVSTLPGQFRLFFKASFESALGRYAAAHESIEEAVEIAPDFAEARVIQSRVLGQLGLEEAALAVASKLVQDQPKFALAWAEHARLALQFGHPQAAQLIVSDALRAGISPSSLSETQGVLTRALSGPIWQKTFEYKSRHYTVRSDIDRQTCFDAAQALESALRLYQRRLSRPGLAATLAETYSVYIFAGRAGYNSYASDLFAGAPENTAGLYSPVLKQLLVWNPIEKKDLESTLRHEGLHQFLDASLGRLPVWFNEGMAEYFENAELIRGVSTVGGPHQDHLDLLRDPNYRWIPYQQLFSMTAADFYRQSAAKYAQSWALVHWIQHSGIINARVFQSLYASLSEGTDSSDFAVVLLALGDLDGLVIEHLKDL